MRSARSERRPATGRTNRSEAERLDPPNSAQDRERRAKWNDPLMFHRPFSPKDPFFPEIQSLPPILPASVYPTVPEVDLPPRRKKQICPDGWVEKLQQPETFDRSGMRGFFDDEEKVQHCRAFLQRNQSQLWKYDHNFIKKTPRTICKSITDDSNYISIMVKLHAKEKTMKLGASTSVKQCLEHPDGSRDVAHKDPFMASLTTAREQRENRRVALLSGGFADASNRRGYSHTPEYGNFSRYNGVIKNNEAAVLKR